MTSIFRIDSRDRDTESPSNTQFTVNCVPTHVQYARLKQVILPNLFDNIRAVPSSDLNNVFSYEVGGVPATIVIPQGFYTIDDLLTLLEAGLTSITFALNTNTGVITLTNSSASSFEVINTADGNSMANVLGITTTATVAPAGTNVFGNKVNLISYSMIYVESRRLSNGHNTTSAGARLPIIATIPMSVSYGSDIIYEPQTQTQIKFEADTNIEEVDIRITNHSGQTLLLPSNQHVQILYEFNETLVI